MIQISITEDAMLALIPWLVFLHTLSALTFFLAHGASIAMAFKVRSETDFARIRAMLDLSASMFMAMVISFLAMGLTGLVMPFILKIWNKGWIWLSIVLMVAVFFHMVFMNDKRYKHLRRMVGLPYMIGGKEFPAEPPASQADVEAHLKKMKVTDLVIVGYGIPMVVLWLMVFKPF
jgi:small-conductance mechanosensitive channel